MLNFIGTGSAFNTKLGNTSAFIRYGKSEDRLVLIDCGSNIFDRIMAGAVALKEYKEISVVLTHLHPDHVGSLGDFIFYCHFILKIRVSIYFPKPEQVREILTRTGCIEDFYSVYGYEDVSYIFRNGDDEIEVEFKPVLVSHTPYLDCYGYFITKGSQSIYYSGDANRFNFEALAMLQEGKLDAIYQDTCLAEYPGNVHYPLSALETIVAPEYRDKVYVMHIDNDELPEKAEALGFKVARNC